VSTSVHSGVAGGKQQLDFDKLRSGSAVQRLGAAGGGSKGEKKTEGSGKGKEGEEMPKGHEESNRD
jgi:hypothetical protein